MSCWCATAGDASLERENPPYGGFTACRKLPSVVSNQMMFMGKKSRRTIKGTSKDDVLTGTQKNDRIKGYAGDDIIDSGAGMDKVWGMKGRDRFVTKGFAKGHMKIMDIEDGEVIEFCGCPQTRLVQKRKNVWIKLGEDVKAVVVNAKADDFEIDFKKDIITYAPDSLA